MRFLVFLCPLFLLSGQVLVSPQQPTVPSGSSITLTSNGPVTWSLNGRGSLSNATPTSVTFTAPGGIVAKNQMLGCQVAPNDSIFNTRIDSLPVNRQSSAWISGSTTDPTFFETDNWGISAADGTTPSKTMRTYYSGSTIPNFVMPTAGPNLKRQGGAHVGIFGSASPADHHVMTVRHTDCTIYESYDDYLDGYTRACRDGSAGCNTQSAIAYPAMTYNMAGPDHGTNAGGLPLAPTTWHLSEIQSGSINHATVFTSNTAAIAWSQILWPAASSAGGCDSSACPNAMPMGARLRLKGWFDATSVCNSGVTAQDAACNTMLTALKQYGIILCDTGLANAVQLASDVTEDPAVEAALQQLVNARIPFSSFEAVDESSLEVSASSYQVCPFGQACLNGTNNYIWPNDQAVVIATSTDGTSLSAPVAIQGVGIGVGIPETVAIAAGNYSYQIPYWVNGAASQVVSWHLVSGVGSVSSGGIYTPPAATNTPGGTQLTVLQGVSQADSAATIALHLTVLPAASNGAVRIDTGSPTSTTDANGNVWTADIGMESGAVSITSDYPHWNNANPAAAIVYETSRHADADLGNTIIVPNGTYNLHLLFGMPDNGNCTSCISWLTSGAWNQYSFAPYILEAQGTVQNSTFDFGALSGYLFQVPEDAYLPATVTNNILQVYVRSVQSDQPGYQVNPDAGKHTFLNGLEIVPASLAASSPAPSWTIDTNSQTSIATGQTLKPFSIVAAGGASNDPTWSILSGPPGASLSGSTLSLASDASPNGQPIIVAASDANLSATVALSTTTTTKPNPKDRLASTQSSFAFTRPLTISHSSIGTSDLLGFPVVVSISDQTLANSAYGGHVVNLSGYDIVLASDSAGKNLLNWEVESYDSTNGTWIAHVQIPVLSHTTDTTIYLLYGNSQITSLQSTANQVWDGAYTGVFHFEGSPTGVTDSTSYGNSATESSLIYSSGVLAGGALAYGGSAGLPSVLLNQPAGTFETWVFTGQPQDIRHDWFLLSQSGATELDYFRLGWSGVDDQFEAQWSSANSGSTLLGFNSLQAPVGSKGWVHVAYSWNSYDNYQSLYLNGLRLGSYAANIPLLSSANLVELGSSSPGGTDSLKGLLDETRFSSIERSPDWIAAEYSSQASPANFVVVGSEVATNN